MDTRLYYGRPAGLPDVELLYCGDSDFAMAPHIHQRWVLWLTTGGAERFRCHGTESVLQPDSFSLIPPGEVHANRAFGTQRTLLSFYLPDTLLQGHFEEYGGRDALLRNGILLRDGRVRRMLARLHRQLLHCPEQLSNQCAISQVLEHITDLCKGAPADISEPGADTGRIRRAIDLLRTRLSDNPGLADLAQACACSQRHILRLFKTHVGMPPGAYLLELRLEQARQRIAAGTDLATAALDCGFTDQSHLNRRFKARFGVTPGAYRKQTRDSRK